MYRPQKIIFIEKAPKYWTQDSWVAIHMEPCIFIPPASTKLKGGYTRFTLSVCLFRPSAHLSVCLSVDRMESALYIQQYLPDPFDMYISYQTTLESIFRFKVLFKIKKLEILTNSLDL